MKTEQVEPNRREVPAPSSVQPDSLSLFWRNARIILACLVAGGLVFGGWAFALSVLLGGLVAELNFRALKAGVDRVLVRNKGAGQGMLVIGFMARVILIFLCLFVMIHFSFLSLYGAVLGLSIFVLAGIAGAVLVLVGKQV